MPTATAYVDPSAVMLLSTQRIVVLFTRNCRADPGALMATEEATPVVVILLAATVIRTLVTIRSALRYDIPTPHAKPPSPRIVMTEFMSATNAVVSTVSELRQDMTARLAEHGPDPADTLELVMRIVFPIENTAP